MADETVLVVREWAIIGFAIAVGTDTYPAGEQLVNEHNAVVAQLAAMTAERDAARKPCADSCEAMLIVESQDLRLHTLMSKLTAMTAEREHWFAQCQRMRDQLTAMTAERDEAKSHAAQFFATMLDLADDLAAAPNQDAAPPDLVNAPMGTKFMIAYALYTEAENPPSVETTGPDPTSDDVLATAGTTAPGGQAGAGYRGIVPEGMVNAPKEPNDGGIDADT